MELLLISAGRGSRMGEIMVPKTLVPVNGVPNLANTLSVIGSHFTKITIAVTHSMLHHFAKFIKEGGYKNVTLLPISSGLGSGHAVMMALKSMISNLRAKASAPFLITWGDVYFKNDQLILELINEEKVYECIKHKPTLIIPCAWNDKPYISISCNSELDATGITFNDSKRGLHDQSTFLVLNGAEFYRQLNSMHNAIWNGDHYITAIREFGFLQIVSYCNNINKPAKVYITENSIQSYNTIEELKQIEASIGAATMSVSI